MTTVIETLGVVCGLAGQIPGVKVLSSGILANEARIVVRVSGAETIDAIQFITGSANADIDPWIRKPEPDAEAELTIVASFLPRDELEFGELQIVGIHLVWRLHRIGLLQAADANRLLHKWGAVEVGI